MLLCLTSFTQHTVLHIISNAYNGSQGHLERRRLRLIDNRQLCDLKVTVSATQAPGLY